MPIVWIAPTKIGAGNGSSPADATTLDKLNDMIKAAGPAGEVRLRPDMGEYVVTSTVSVSAGGAEGAQTQIRAMTPAGRQARAIIRSDRTDPWDNPAGAKHGTSLLRLNTGADYLTFKGLDLERCKTAMTVAGSIKGLVFGATSRKDHEVMALWPFTPSDPDYMAKVEAIYAATADRRVNSTFDCVNFRNVYRGFDMPSSAVVDGMSVMGGTWRQTARGFFRFRGASKDLWMQDIDADCGHVKAEDGYWSTAVELNNTAQNCVFIRVNARNAYDTNRTRGYTNGDGMSGERGNRDCLYVRCQTDNNEDGGIETKAQNVIIIGHQATGNRRNLRLWGWGDAHYVDWRDPTMVLPIVDANGAPMRRRGGGPAQAYAYNNTGKVRVFSGVASSTGADVKTWVADGSGAQLWVSRAVQVTKDPAAALTAGAVKFFDAGTFP